MFHCIPVGIAETEKVIAQILYGAVAIRRLHTEVFLGDLSDSPLCSFQDPVKAFRKLIRREKGRFQILDTHEGRQAPGIPAMKSPVPNDHGRNRSDPMRLQVQQSFGLCFNIHRFIGNSP